MKSLLLFRRDLRAQIKHVKLMRTKDDWDSIKAFPYAPVDEHEEPEAPHEIYNRDHYHFGNQGRDADEVHHDDKFFQLRQWQHLHIVPK